MTSASSGLKKLSNTFGNLHMDEAIRFILVLVKSRNWTSPSTDPPPIYDTLCISVPCFYWLGFASELRTINPFARLSDLRRYGANKVAVSMRLLLAGAG